MSEDLLEELIQQGDSSGLKSLLEQNPKLAGATTSHKVSPIMLCCYYRKPELAEIVLDFLDGISIFEAAAMGRTAQVEAFLEAEPSLLDNYSDDGFTPLSLASFFGSEDTVRVLLLAGANPNLPSKNGYSVYPIHSAVASNFTMVAKMLLEAGADINVRQMSGVTPLHSAAHNGNIELLIVLLEAGANVSARMEDGKTPADMALEKGFEEIAKILS